MTSTPQNNPSAPKTKPPVQSQLSGICLATGCVLLVAGCYLDVDAANDATWRLLLMFFSIALFAFAGWYEFKQRAAPSTAPSTRLPAVKAATPPPAAVVALAVVAPPTFPPPPPVQPIRATDAPASAIAQPAGTPFDVATLIKLPLSDLLLAALCKDPQGSRRIFAQALRPGDSDTPYPLPPPNHATPESAHACQKGNGGRPPLAPPALAENG